MYDEYRVSQAKTWHKLLKYTFILIYFIVTKKLDYLDNLCFLRNNKTDVKTNQCAWRYLFLSHFKRKIILFSTRYIRKLDYKEWL